MCSFDLVTHISVSEGSTQLHNRGLSKLRKGYGAYGAVYACIIFEYIKFWDKKQIMKNVLYILKFPREIWIQLG